MLDTRKGITPVIAIVLLLLVTVGAVGVVYTQFQGLVQEPDTGFLEEVDINFQTVMRNGSSPGSMEIRIQNEGEEEYNLTEVARMEYSVPGEERLERDTAITAFDQLSDTGTHECFTADAPSDIQEFGPGTTATCDTGVSMVDPDDEVTLHIVEQESGEEIVSYTCSPSTSSSATC
ncbi:MAG: hypothetical protein ACLFTA_00205 [Candidatus Nanohaloarchaea archaeon]